MRHEQALVANRVHVLCVLGDTKADSVASLDKQSSVGGFRDLLGASDVVPRDVTCYLAVGVFILEFSWPLSSHLEQLFPCELACEDGSLFPARTTCWFLEKGDSFYHRTSMS